MAEKTLLPGMPPKIAAKAIATKAKQELTQPAEDPFDLFKALFTNQGPAKQPPIKAVAPPQLPISDKTNSELQDPDPWSRLGTVGAMFKDLLLGSAKPTNVNEQVGKPPLYMNLPRIDPTIALGQGAGPEGFYSHAERVLGETKQGMFTGSQLLGFLKSRGVKDEELKWSGLLDLTKNSKVSKEEALTALKKAPRVSEIVLGSNIHDVRAAEEAANKASMDHGHLDSELAAEYGPDIEDWPLEAKDRWNKSWTAQDEAHKHVQELGDQRSTQYGPEHMPGWNLPGESENYKEILLTHDDPFSSGEAKFTGSHHGEDNVLAHIRMDERRLAGDPTGVVDTVQEFQSDWQNQGLAKGFKDTALIKRHDALAKEIDVLTKRYDALSEERNKHYYEWTNATRLSNTDPAVNFSAAYQKYKNATEPISEEWRLIGEKRSDLWDERIAISKHKTAWQGVEPAPFVESGSWGELAMKRSLLESARNPRSTHYGWTTGKQQIERSTNELRKNVDQIHWKPATRSESAEPAVHITMFKGKYDMPDTHIVFNHVIPLEGETTIAGKKVTLDSLIDRSWGARFRSAPTGSVHGDNLHVGGAGKIQAYDVARRAELKKLLKVEAKPLEIESEHKYNETRDTYGGVTSAGYTPGKQKIWGFKWTPELKAKVLKEGFPLYSIAPLMLSLKPEERAVRPPLPPPPAGGIRSLGRGLSDARNDHD